MGTYLQNARQALTFLLLFCRQYRIEGLTPSGSGHTLPGLNRVTVTRTLHEIMQEESGQPVGLMDYIQLLYMGTQKEDSGDHWGRYRGQPSKAALAGHVTRQPHEPSPASKAFLHITTNSLTARPCSEQGALPYSRT